MADSPDPARNWHYFGSVFLAMGAGVLGIGALVVYDAPSPRAFFWTTWYALFAYVCFGFAVLCGASAAAGTSFPFGPVGVLGRAALSAGRRIRGFRSSIGHWSPVVWRGFPSARTPRVRILSAKYEGRPNRSADVTETLRGLLSSGVTHFTADNETLVAGNDPDPGYPKILSVQYTVDGVPDSRTFDEGTPVGLP